jgi:hypothetical protein
MYLSPKNKEVKIFEIFKDDLFFHPEKNSVKMTYMQELIQKIPQLQNLNHSITFKSSGTSVNTVYRINFRGV